MTDLVQLIDKVLPIDAGKNGIQYSQSQNMFTTTAYTSIAGNTYFKGIRLSERIFLVLDIGIGYAYTFLNALKIYTNQNGEKKLVATKSYYCRVYNEDVIKKDAKEIIQNELMKEAVKDNLKLDILWLTDFVDNLVEDTYKNQIENLKTMQLNNLLTK